MLTLFEDVDWADAASLEVLDLTVERVRASPGISADHLPAEFQPPWTGQPQVTMLALNRLDRRDRTALVEQIAVGKVLPDEVVAQIADRTDGPPGPTPVSQVDAAGTGNSRLRGRNQRCFNDLLYHCGSPQIKIVCQ